MEIILATISYLALNKIQTGGMDKSDPLNPVSAALNEIGLGKFYNALRHDGVDSMDELRGLTNFDLEAAGMKRLQIRLFRNHFPQDIEEQKYIEEVQKYIEEQKDIEDIEDIEDAPPSKDHKQIKQLQIKQLEEEILQRTENNNNVLDDANEFNWEMIENEYNREKAEIEKLRDKIKYIKKPDFEFNKNGLFIKELPSYNGVCYYDFMINGVPKRILLIGENHNNDHIVSHENDLVNTHVMNSKTCLDLYIENRFPWKTTYAEERQRREDREWAEQQYREQEVHEQEGWWEEQNDPNQMGQGLSLLMDTEGLHIPGVRIHATDLRGRYIVLNRYDEGDQIMFKKYSLETIETGAIDNTGAIEKKYVEYVITPRTGFKYLEEEDKIDVNMASIVYFGKHLRSSNEYNNVLAEFEKKYNYLYSKYKDNEAFFDNVDHKMMSLLELKKILDSSISR